MTSARSIGWAILSGLLLVAAYRIPGLWPLSFVALVPLLYAIYSAQGYFIAFTAGGIAGTMLAGAGSIWFFSALPLPTLFGIITPEKAVLFVAISWIEVALATGIVTGIWAALIRVLDPRRVLDILAIGALYGLADYARMFTFNLLTISAQVQNPPFYSAGFIGYPLMDNASFRQLAILGIFAVSIVVVWVNALIYSRLRFAEGGRRVVAPAGLALGLMLIAIIPLASIRAYFDGAPAATVAVGIVSVPYPVQQKQLTMLAAQAASGGADIILLPESSQLFKPFSMVPSPAAFSATSTAIVVDNGPYGSEQTRTERAYADSAGGQKYIRDKSVFTPEGEYLPAISRLMIELAGATQEVDEYDLARNFTAGDSGAPVIAGNISASLLFCEEVMQPGIGAALVRTQGAQIILVASSHSWFHDSSALELDTLRFARAQAVRAGIPLANSSSGGFAFVIDRYGRILSRIGQGGQSAESVVQTSFAPP